MCVCVGGGGVRTRNVCVCVCGVRTRNVCVLQGVTAIDWFPYTSIHTGRNQSPQGMTFQQHPTILKSVFPPVYSSNRVAG